MDDLKDSTRAEPIELVPMARPVSAEIGIAENASPPKKTGGGRLAALIDLALFGTGAVGLFVLVLLVGVALHKLGVMDHPSDHGLAVQLIWSLLLCAWIGVIAGRRESRWAAIGWTTDHLFLNVGVGISVWLGLVVFAMGVSFVVLLVWPDGFRSLAGNRENVSQIFGPITIGQIVGMCAMVGLYEEVIFRGFLLDRFRRLTGSVVAAVLISTALFGSLHLYEGPVAMGVISGLGLILCLVVLWRKSLVPAVVAHFLFNTGMFLMMRLGPEVDLKALDSLTQ